MMNVAILMGRLVADPELKHTPSGAAVTSFTLAVDRAYSKQERTAIGFSECRRMAVNSGIYQQVFSQRPDDGGAGFHPDALLYGQGRQQTQGI